MRFKVIFKQKNPQFDKEYAKQYYDGKESVNNQKNLWSTTYTLDDDVKEYSISESGEYNLKGTLISGEEINEELTNMHILKCYDIKNVEIGSFGISQNLIEKTYKAFDKKHNITRYYFYLKTNAEFIELKKGVFVALNNIPEKLMQN